MWNLRFCLGIFIVYNCSWVDDGDSQDESVDIRVNVSCVRL